MIKKILIFILLFSPFYSNAIESKIFKGNKYLENRYPDKELVSVSRWKSVARTSCKGNYDCRYLMTRTIKYKDGTTLEERYIGEGSPPDYILNKPKEYILKLYGGRKAYKSYFPNKEIEKKEKWYYENSISCKKKIKTVSTGGRTSSSHKVEYGKECKQVRARFIYYTDGTIIKEKRIVKTIDRNGK